MNIDFEELFNNVPGNYCALLPDEKYTIFAVNDAFCKISQVTKEYLLGKGLFEGYPEDPNGKGTSNIEKVRNSIEECIKTKQFHNTGMVRYDIPTNDSKGYDVKYWSPTHTPVLDEKGNIKYIIESALDITNLVNLGLEIPENI